MEKDTSEPSAAPHEGHLQQDDGFRRQRANLWRAAQPRGSSSGRVHANERELRSHPHPEGSDTPEQAATPDQAVASSQGMLVAYLALVRRWFAWANADNLMQVNPIWTGFIGSLLVFLGSLQANSPFTSKIPGSWYLGVDATPHPGNVVIELLAQSLVYYGLILTGVAWLRIVVGSRRGEVLRHRWILFGLWILPLMVAGPLFSRDVYSYAAQGRMVTLGINPYSGGPALLGNSAYRSTVDPLWGMAKAPYGPLFLALAGGLVELAGRSPMLTVLFLRLVALVSVVVIGIFVLKIADLLGVNRDLAFALSAANPILLYTFASAGHNDALMTALMVIGIYLFLKDRRLAGIVVVALAASVKVPAIVAIGFMGYHWSDSERVVSKLRGLVIAIMLTFAIFYVLGLVTHLGMGWIPALSTPGSVLSFEDPIILVGYALGWVLAHLGLPFGPHFVVGVFRAIGDALILLIGGVTILGSRRSNIVRLTGVVLIVTVVLGPVIWPWYLGWGIVLLALGAGDLTVDFLVLLTLSAMPIDFLGAPTAFAWIGYAGLVTVLYRRRASLLREANEVFAGFRAAVGEAVPARYQRWLPQFIRVDAGS
ncbi:polyprenol phosphomannose-dependent alpha 1,6 mannosyltransferase MptB [Ferrimicrobium sp.]|uniref:polyprenol phosphomannose-dependent alpha 1,6 mannosyltransferase MptB n=1 Tax=Ferrimicrobium sp. TaxID=2926050 RepID=UPI002627B215|nr:polyprenol phosphomannose-dependent alpha 1,6 mannosyltransferase MptB [Ferrimicrobium sp.]